MSSTTTSITITTISIRLPDAYRANQSTNSTVTGLSMKPASTPR